MDVPADLVGAISRYRLIKQLYRGSRTLVYQAIRESDAEDGSAKRLQHQVVIKLLNRDYPNFRELLQFRNQYTIAKNLPLLGIVSVYSLESYRNTYAIVMEDFGGVSLQQYIQMQTLTLAEVLDIIRQLAEILEGLYRQRVIHKDIKPANILIHPETKQIKLIDFSIASLLPKETQEIQNPNILEGTLAYISPEQTGRMNRGIDYRPAIEIVKEYGQLPPVECYPGQLNQVFMNILANAIDALEEANQGRSLVDIKANPNRITIRTEIKDSRWIEIRIADNGKGMNEEVKQRIFDYLFTTKGVGKGTGLGLAIARQIVVEKHGGTIEVNSTLGRGTEFAIALPINGKTDCSSG